MVAVCAKAQVKTMMIGVSLQPQANPRSGRLRRLRLGSLRATSAANCSDVVLGGG
jgi:hypothetical protein